MPDPPDHPGFLTICFTHSGDEAALETLLQTLITAAAAVDFDVVKRTKKSVVMARDYTG